MSSEVIRATDECVMCGLCLPHCPTYQSSKIEAESPRGRIALVRALHENKLQVNTVLTEHLDSCLTCLRCESVCPANVEYENIIDAGRAITQTKHARLYKLKESFILLSLTNRFVRRLFKFLISIFRLAGLSKILYHFTNLPLSLRGLELISVTHKFNFGSNTQLPNKNNLRVAIALSCANDLLSDATVDAVKSILKALTYNIVLINNNCCGALHQHTGKIGSARRQIHKFTSEFDKNNYDVIVSIATGCGAHIQRLQKLISDENTKRVSKKHADIISFLASQNQFKNLKFKALRKKAFLHIPCSQSHSSDDLEVVQKTLSSIPEIQIEYLHGKYACCGAGGLNTFTHSERANRLLEENISELISNNADYLVTSNIGCAMHYQACLNQKNSKIIVCHPVTLLAQQLI